MPKADTSVKWFHQDMADAPTLSNVGGSIVNLIDACLINGFSTRSPDSVVVADGVATVTISTGNPYEKHAVIAISSSSAPDLNAEWRIATSAAASFTFACPDVADGTVTGASIKRAPAGWVKPFSDTNIGVYQSADTSSTQLFLCVNDAATNYALVRGYENMTGASAGTGPFPTIAQVSQTNLRWPKSAANTWAIIADGSMVWLLLRGSSDASGYRLMHHFGDLVSFLPGDAYHCTLAAVNGASTTGPGHVGAGTTNGLAAPRSIARGPSQTGSAVTSFVCSFMSFGATWTGWASAAGSLDGNQRIAGSVYAHVGFNTNDHARGILPGPVTSLESPTFTDLSVVEVGDAALLAVKCNTALNGNGAGIALFDITGPWR